MKYQPDPNVLPMDPWTQVYLSNRDLAYQVPINFVTHPGVSVTATCFADRVYSAKAAERCISNLLAAQFRRLVLDVYWDANARQFGLCPVQIPPSTRATTGVEPTTLVSISPLISTVHLTHSTKKLEQARARQATPAPSSASFNMTANASSISTSSQVLIETVIGSSGETVFTLGSYQCSPNLDIQSVSPLILSYLQNTSDTINARLLWLEFNLHAAASATTPEDPAEAPPSSTLPTGAQLLGQVMNSTLRAYIYTPPELTSDRSDLNESWYRDPAVNSPNPGYYTTQKEANGILSTPDGWPTEGYVQLTKLMRVLLSWGTVDPQMANYSFSGDAGTVFAPGHLSKSTPIQTNNAGQVTSGCFFDVSVTNVASFNSSWALFFSTQTTSALTFVNNLTACGISPVLNVTLDNGSADRNAASYMSFARSATWNWAPGEPLNKSVSVLDESYRQSEFRCALMDISGAYVGYWRVEDCPNNYRAACRINNQPYKWALSNNAVSFYDAPYSCPIDSTFAAPRTGLENHYLRHIVLSSGDKIATTEAGKGVWLNFNSLDTATCWVTTGPNGTCPYYVNKSAEQSRQILVPTVGAIIVFVLTALTIFVKCNANRRNSRTRRRGDGGWDYEGVPS